MIIETERLILRPFEERDQQPFADINADPEVMHYFPAPLTSTQTAAQIQRFEDQRSAGNFHVLAAELKSTGKCIGFVGLAPISDKLSSSMYGRPQVEVGWRLGRKNWGQGLAPEGAHACLIYAWETLQLDEVVSFTSRNNLPSQRVMQKIGMTNKSSDDFMHPNLPEGHELRSHVLYRISNPNI